MDTNGDGEQAAKGEAPLEQGSTESEHVRDAPYPHFEIPDHALDGRNADRVPRVPEGPRRGPLGPTARRTEPEEREGEEEL